MAKILMFGGSGLIGSHLYAALKSLGHKVFIQSRSDTFDIKLDPFDKNKILSTLFQLQPDLVINLIANTDVDGCETNISDAFLVNTKVCQIIAKAVNELDFTVRLIHISTDQVYTGFGFQSEVDAKPENIYALTKYAGELEVIAFDGLVLRANFLCGDSLGNGNGLCNWIYRSLLLEAPIKVFEDVLFNPIHPSYLAVLITALVDIEITGIYNVASIGGMSKADLARCFCERFSFSASNMASISIDEYQLLAKRPQDMRMDVSKISDILPLSLPSINTTLECLFEDFKSN